MEQAGALSGSVSLVERIGKTIAPYKYNNKKPPFTPDELFTMVIAVKGRPVTKGQVLQWVFANFKYYKKMVEGEFVDDDPKQFNSDDIYGWRKPETKSGRFRTNINEVPRNHELYLSTESAPNGSARYSMTMASSERILSRVLTPQHPCDGKAFAFFDLPPELRNKIFDLVFQYPRSGLLFAAEGQKKAIIDAPADYDTQGLHTYNKLERTARIADVLAPLLVNRQFYEEAKGCFFAVNHFHFLNLRTMSGTLAKISESQRRHIQHVTLDYSVWAYELPDAKEAITLLVTCGLKKLNLYLKEDRWREQGMTRRGKILKSRNNVMNIPGMRKLRAMRGLEEVNFYGCPTVEALIKADMLKPKPKPKQKRTGGTKRKAEGESEGGKKSSRR
ncbi:hypothetical protein KC343_g8335 [Hortaea werneckii]|nr:hypothetical protein KC352_g20005 [Hortaea werneckii]KAI7355484.1 hypothetical protein KC320_g2794 [Hortaea werneckii]KAI7571540.1 hypothetical protein KC317_g1539 [Hortaea werneckii]KAI7620585.1 hypothetical protein KC343_g8335 [Hortaea werneckii]KAI7621937.1 hypothetical protein KC346_g3440 [Hortaea werneckii]